MSGTKKKRFHGVSRHFTLATADRSFDTAVGGVTLTRLTLRCGRRVGFLHFVSGDLAPEPA